VIKDFAGVTDSLKLGLYVRTINEGCRYDHGKVWASYIDER
jgi:hypothetical protein